MYTYPMVTRTRKELSETPVLQSEEKSDKIKSEQRIFVSITLS